MDLQSDFLKDDIKNTWTQLTQHILQLQNNSDLIYCYNKSCHSFYPARPETQLAVSHDFCFFG